MRPITQLGLGAVALLGLTIWLLWPYVVSDLTPLSSAECVGWDAHEIAANPNELVVLGCYRFGELPPGPFLFGVEDLEAARAADRPRH